MAWQVGDRVRNDQYEIKLILGRGYFGITYLIEDQNHQQFTLKTLSDTLHNSPQRDRFEEKFMEEASRLRQCRNPHIVKVEEIFKERDRWCITLEYIDGSNLYQISRNRLPLPEEEALDYIRQIGEALTEVHKHKLAHRDVKPQNIMLRAGKSDAVLIDFGLIQKFDHPLTNVKPSPGSDGFAPLEMYLSNRPCGAYTDIYSLAATLYYLLVGKLPPKALDRSDPDNPVSLQPQTENPKISDTTHNAILKGMALNGETRPQTMEEWLNLLPSPPKPPPPPKPSIDWTKWSGIAAIAAVVVAIFAALPAWFPYLERLFPSPPTEKVTPEEPQEK